MTKIWNIKILESIYKYNMLSKASHHCIAIFSTNPMTIGHLAVKGKDPCFSKLFFQFCMNKYILFGTCAKMIRIMTWNRERNFFCAKIFKIYSSKRNNYENQSFS